MAGSDVLVWLDMEMTGLDPDRERIIEVAVIITDGQLGELATGPDLVIHQSDELLAAMDDWNRTHHTASGLVDRVRASQVTEADAEAQLLAFIQAHVPSPKDRPVLAGNSIHQDRRFIRRYMPKLDARLHYRMVDVSTIKELARRWYPQALTKQPPKNDTHRALDDIRESIDELRFYRASVFAPAAAPAAAPAPTAPAAPGTPDPAPPAPARHDRSSPPPRRGSRPRRYLAARGSRRPPSRRPPAPPPSRRCAPAPRRLGALRGRTAGPPPARRGPQPSAGHSARSRRAERGASLVR